MKISKEYAKDRISFLRGEIERHNRRYYIDNEPTVSDFEFDLLLQELQTLENKFPEFSSNDSPTFKIGSDVDRYSSESDLKEFRQSQHRSPMLSLSNTYNKEDLYAFNERIEKISGTSAEYVCELKIDGSAISLTYENCKLVKAVTRGDGNIGDDVTENVKMIDFFPKEIGIKSKVKNFDIRGEIYMPWDQFNRLNRERELTEEQLFSNPRNAAAGSLKLINSSEVKERGLKILLYNVIEENKFFKTHSDSLQWASSEGFPVSPHYKICKNIDEVIDFLDIWDIKRKELSFPTDGVVIKVNSYELQNALGVTSKFPRWATAYKFKAEQAVTRLVSVDYQVGRTGAVTPVANLEPVTLSGSVIRRASLHNSDQMRLLDIHLGDYVIIEKGGEIIPKIVGVEFDKRDPGAVIPEFPHNCPDCGSNLVKDTDESRHYCPNNIGCPTQIKGKLLHFAGRKAMNILAGEATIDQMYNLGYLNSLSDYYKISFKQLTEMEGWKERSAQRFLESVQESLNVPFYKVLFALGIRHVGETTAKSLANHFGNIESIMSASFEELLEVGDIGEIVARSISEYFTNDSNRRIIRELEGYGVSMRSGNNLNIKSEKLKEKTIVISGNFSISREELKRIIEENSGKNSSSVSASTSFIVAGDKAGPSKLEKARKLGISVLSEDDFFSFINN